ncbi:MAG: hypothetical protein H6607_06760 [Flavobacteriales bacterium]|nr:hypothetical protein [Flavobacteriales bacterium]
MDLILNGLNHKADLKQRIYKNSLEIFEQFKTAAQEIAGKLAPEVLTKNSAVEVIVNDFGQFEFHLKFSGDTIVFILHTNVFTFPPEHLMMKSKYIKENEDRGYFAMIQIYNFLSDSIKYNRLADPGYLLARFFVNIEDRFYVEGKRQLAFLYKEPGKHLVSKESIDAIIEQCMLYCLDFDLFVPPAENFSQITIEQKNYFNNPSGLATGKRLGFDITNRAN